MKLPERLLGFVDPQDGHGIASLDALVDAWLLANEAGQSSNDLPPATEIVLEMSSSPENRGFLWRFVQQAAHRATTKFQLAMIAAGPLEDLIVGAGLDYIEQIEQLARKSVRFRYVLTGVWFQELRDGVPWQRIEAARATMVPHGIDSNADIPPADLPI